LQFESKKTTMEKTQTHIGKRPEFKHPEPPMYHVIMHNDDITTMDFVVEVLIRVFRKTATVAEQTMLKIHNEGSAVAGTYHYDIAHSKANYAMAMAREKGFPLQLTVEET
jgi:ATP-dependent Clp protease adaptor protein ClpS